MQAKVTNSPALVGAKTVKGPSPERVPTRSAATNKDAKVEKSSLVVAMSTMEFVAEAGNKTESTTCTTPFVAATSGAVMVAWLIMGGLRLVMLAVSMFTISTIIPRDNEDLGTLPAVTWYVKISTKCAAHSSSRYFAGTFRNLKFVSGFRNWNWAKK